MSKDRHTEGGLRPDCPETGESDARGGARERLSDATAAGTPPLGGEAAAGASPSNTHLPSSRMADEQPPLTPTDTERMMYETIMLTKDSYSGPVECLSLFPGAVFAIDWLEESGLVAWDLHHGMLRRVEDLQRVARERNEPQELELAGAIFSVHGDGLGSGRQQRLSYRLERPGIIFAFSPRSSQDRQHPNMYLKITGEACLLEGALQSRALTEKVIEELGGIILDKSDRWLRRIDLCLDLPGVDLGEWVIPSFRAGNFLATSSNWNPWDGKKGCSGFTVGNSKRVRLNVYDKLRQAKKASEAYLAGMVQNRWNGVMPVAATRVEYQIRKAWLDQFALRDTDRVLKMLPAIVALLTELSKRPFFAMTAGPVDRKNKHQCRSEPHPEWAKLVGTFRQLVGTPTEPLKKIERHKFSHDKACQMLLGFATSAAAYAGVYAETLEELFGDYVVKIVREAGYSEEKMKDAWRRKALKAGTVRDPESFDFGANTEGGEQCS